VKSCSRITFILDAPPERIYRAIRMSAGTILVVDDDPQIRRVLRIMLTGQGYEIDDAKCGEGAIEKLRKRRFDLVLLDVGMPGMGGLEACRAIREQSEIAIIMLTVRDRDIDKIEALDAGADDYVTKPFSAPELLARVRAALRRNVRSTEAASVLHLNDIEVDLERRETHGPQGEIHLTPLEYRVLECLARHLGSIVVQNQLVREVWGPERLGDTRSLRVCVKNLRNKLEPDPRKPRYLVTEAGLGYRLRADEADATAV
jgi:two-component system KDP operon response regulator KdpE